jgi:hypothetical protein
METGMRSDITTDSPGFGSRELAAATAVTLVGSVAAVLIIRAIAVNVVSVSPLFEPLKTGSVLALTILGVLAAGAACAGLNRFVAGPIRSFRRIAPIALALSFIPDFAIWILGAYHDTAQAKTVIPLLVMHVAVASICYTLLPRLGAARKPTAAPRVNTTGALAPQ